MANHLCAATTRRDRGKGHGEDSRPIQEMKELGVALPTAMLVIMDVASSGEIPKKLGPSRIAATSSSVVVGTRRAADGETSIAVSSGGVVSPDQPALDVTIDALTQRVNLFSVLHEALCEVRVSSGRVRVRVWTNHPSEPEHIIVVLGGSGLDC